MDRKSVINAAATFAEIGRAEQASAHQQASKTSIHEVAGWLQNNLGQRLTAYGINAKDPRQVGRFAGREERPSQEQAQSLRGLYEVGLVVTAKDSPEVFRAWIIGANPELNDHAAIEVWHEGKIDLDLN